MMTLRKLVASEGDLLVEIVGNVICGNTKGLFLLDQCDDIFFYSARVGFYVNILLWATSPPPPLPKNCRTLRINILVTA